MGQQTDGTGETLCLSSSEGKGSFTLKRAPRREDCPAGACSLPAAPLPDAGRALRVAVQAFSPASYRDVFPSPPGVPEGRLCRPCSWSRDAAAQPSPRPCPGVIVNGDVWVFISVRITIYIYRDLTSNIYEQISIYCDFSNNNNNEAASKVTSSSVPETKGLNWRDSPARVQLCSAWEGAGRGPSSQHTCAGGTQGVGSSETGQDPLPASGSWFRSKLWRSRFCWGDSTENPSPPPPLCSQAQLWLHGAARCCFGVQRVPERGPLCTPFSSG